jgi:hypothetical protein
MLCPASAQALAVLATLARADCTTRAFSAWSAIRVAWLSQVNRPTSFTPGRAAISLAVADPPHTLDELRRFAWRLDLTPQSRHVPIYCPIEWRPKAAT